MARWMPQQALLWQARTAQRWEHAVLSSREWAEGTNVVRLHRALHLYCCDSRQPSPCTHKTHSGQEVSPAPLYCNPPAPWVQWAPTNCPCHLLRPFLEPAIQYAPPQLYRYPPHELCVCDEHPRRAAEPDLHRVHQGGQGSRNVSLTARAGRDRGIVVLGPGCC